MKRIIPILLAVTLLLALAACTSTPTGEGAPAVENDETESASTTQPEAQIDQDEETGTDKKGGVLKIAIANDPDSLMVHKVRLGVDAVQPIYEGLMTYDETGEPVPNLAKSLTANSEELTYTIELNEGILFHDGSELTAEVCKWNLIKYRDEGVLGASYLSYLGDVEVTGNYTVVLHLTQWDSQMPYILSRQMGYMQSQQAFETHGEEYMAEHPVGTGPFVFDSWEHGVSINFVRNENYWKGDVFLDGVELVIYSEALTAQAAIEAGEVDVWTAKDFDIANSLEEEGFTAYGSSVPYFSYAIHFHTADGPFADLRVRQAVAYAIDREAIVSLLTAEKAVLSNQFVAPGNPYYNDQIDGYPYNIEKAKQLLAEAGYPDGFKTVITTYNVGSQNTIALILIEMLKEIGIELEMVDLDVASYVLKMDGWGEGLLNKAVTLDSGVGSQINGMYLPGRENGFGVGSFPQPAELLEAIEIGVNTSGQDSINGYKEAEKIIIDNEVMSVFFGVNRKITITQTYVHDTGWGAIASFGNTLGEAWLEK